MAREFGGKFSPGGDKTPTGGTGLSANKFRGRKVHNSNFRARLMFVVPLPLLFSGIGELLAQNPIAMLIEFGALALLLLAAWLLRDGLAAEAAYHTRKVARPPSVPRKAFAAGLTGIGVTLAAFGGVGLGIVYALIYGTLATAAHIASFGLDPMRNKGMEGYDEFETDRVAKAVEKAESLLKETLQAASRIGDRKLEGRVETFASSVRDVFRAVEEDPRDLTGARKFLTVYLRGARDATVKFADIYSRNKDTDARRDYEALLADLETSFNSQRDHMLLDDRSDLDVEIEVLRDRLKQEGLKAR
ncbi:MAG: hypothetical protein GY947_02970 [Rhodobacteraceae bacterium]|nr:hypothetical protein [Paracoccaceae bacterium]